MPFVKLATASGNERKMYSETGKDTKEVIRTLDCYHTFFKGYF